MGRILGRTAAAVVLAACSVAGAQDACPLGQVHVAAGDLWVGSPYGECPDESVLPLDAVHVRAMCIDRRPVTVAEYDRCVASGGCPPRDAAAGCASDPGAPVDCVSWEGARRYCTARGAHLPTEAQLDRALRALGEGNDDQGEWTATAAEERRPWLPRRRGGASGDRIVRWGPHHLGNPVPWNEPQVSVGLRCRTEPAPDAPPPELRDAWAAPRCVAYSHDEQAYACLDFSLSTDDMGEAGLEPMDFERWAAEASPPAHVAWGGHKALRLISPEGQRSLAIASRDYFGDGPVTHVRSEEAAVRLAASHGHRAPVDSTRALPNGRWVSFHGVWLRFESHLHVGGASESYIGSLRLACEDPDVPGVATRELLPARRAESAVAFSARGAPAFVVGLMRQGGGEGSWYFDTRYVRVTRDACP